VSSTLDALGFVWQKILIPTYAAACLTAQGRGVEMLCYDCDVSITEINLRGSLPLCLSTQDVAKFSITRSGRV